MSDEFQVSGKNADVLFTLKIHRGDGMAFIAMNWKEGKPPKDFVGFAIEYKEPGGHKFFALKNRLSFPGVDGEFDPNAKSWWQNQLLGHAAAAVHSCKTGAG